MVLEGNAPRALDAPAPMSAARYVRRVVVALVLLVAALGLAWMAPGSSNAEQQTCPAGSVPIAAHSGSGPTAGCMTQLRTGR